MLLPAVQDTAPLKFCHRVREASAQLRIGHVDFEEKDRVNMRLDRKGLASCVVCRFEQVVSCVVCGFAFRNHVGSK